MTNSSIDAIRLFIETILAFYCVISSDVDIVEPDKKHILMLSYALQLSERDIQKLCIPDKVNGHQLIIGGQFLESKLLEHLVKDFLLEDNCKVLFSRMDCSQS